MIMLLQMRDIRDCIFLLTTSAFIGFSKANGMSSATYIVNNNLRNNFCGNILVYPVTQKQR